MKGVLLVRTEGVIYVSDLVIRVRAGGCARVTGPVENRLVPPRLDL
jgi:hypothetical protein